LIVLALSLISCASVQPANLNTLHSQSSALPSSAELDAPFFPQLVHQCGPAALATVLVGSGVMVTPEVLAEEVYIPKRKGSLQPELIAAMRTRDRLPYVMSGKLDDVVAEVAAGHPVLVLQNLGLRHLPVWHYAVVIGYDVMQDQLILRSGKTQRLVMRTAEFERTWDLAGHWAIVALPPGTSPARPDLQRYMSAAAGFEELGNGTAAERAYLYARAQWPQAALPWLGLANIAQARGQYAEAQRAYLEAIARDPVDPIARNNLADTLARRGCLSDARRELERALQLAHGTPAETLVRESSQELAARLESDTGSCFVSQ
jgi:hypothetical protein